MKKLLPVIIVLVVLVGGGAALVLTKDNKKSSNTNTSSKSDSSDSANSTNAFDALSTTGNSFVATFTTNTNGKEVKTVLEYDQKNSAYRYTIDENDANAYFVYTKDAYYICQSAKSCFKYPVSQSGQSGFDPKTYEYTSEELASFKNTAADQGEASCPAGTCHVWKISNGGYDSTIYIDTKTKRISQVEGTNAAGYTKIIYEYKDVTVTPPANAQELPSV